MALRSFHVHVVGTTALLMHNARLANPMDEIVRQMRAITSKHSSKKTEEDLEELARLEFVGGLYMTQAGPYVPAMCLERAMAEAARRVRKGKDIERGVDVVALTGDLDKIQLKYDGPKTAKGLWGRGPVSNKFVDQRIVGVQQSKILRTRPVFHVWELEFGILFDAEVIDAEMVEEFLIGAGAQVGLMDGRRIKCGRFRVAKCVQQRK